MEVPLPPRNALLQIKHMSPPTLLATAAVLVSTDRDGRLRRHPLARRLGGVSIARAQRMTHAVHWQRLNLAAETASGPVWIVLGDSAAQGIGAADPELGYVGRVRAALNGRDGVTWRVVNLSTAGAMALDVLVEQIPVLLARPDPADLISCGVGSNDLMRTSPRRLRRQLAEVSARLPTGSVVLNLSLGLRGFGRGYVRRINDTIEESAAEHGHRVADVWTRFGPPWRGKFGPDGFHPSAHGYADWAAAVLAALPPRSPA
jgi:acyl-CoA thioesterase I